MKLVDELIRRSEGGERVVVLDGDDSVGGVSEEGGGGMEVVL